jgi:hypothetical protein
MNRATRSTRRGLGILAAALLLTARARALDSTPGESSRALPGLIRVGIPAAPVSALTATSAVSYGWLDPAADLQVSGHRLGATVAAAFQPIPALALAADVRGYVDVFSRPTSGSEANLYGEPRLTARYSLATTERWLWGAEADVRFIGATAPSIYWPATSASIRALLGTRLTQRSWLGAQLGFHLDRSGQVVPDPERVSASDRRTLEMSDWNALQWGVGASHRLTGANTELLAELSGELLVGAGAPGALRSPWQLSLGARQPLGAAFSLSVSADVGLSARGPRTASDLQPIPPRLGCAVGLAWHLGAPAPPAVPEPAPPPSQEAPPEPPRPPPPAVSASSPVSGTVVDEGGRPLPDALVTLTAEGAQPRETRSAEDGRFTFTEVPGVALELRASAAGFDDTRVEISAAGERSSELVLHPSVPAGQVRGRVLDLGGTPVPASIRITPGDHQLEAGSDGSFTIELAPGRYTLELQHPGFAPQQRVIVVRERGVVILNLALGR